MNDNYFHIKNMVCKHCGEVLETKLVEAGFPIKHIELGKIEFARPIEADEVSELLEVVHQNGFEIVSDRSSQLVEQIKHLIIGLIHQGKRLDTTLSTYLSMRLHREYQHLSRLFSEVEGRSIERFLILQKIERAKELIVYGEQTMAEIAYQLDYSSQQHFSRQFKKETGLTPSHFNDIKENKRISIDRL